MRQKSAFDAKRLVIFSVAKRVIGIKSDIPNLNSALGDYFK